MKNRLFLIAAVLLLLPCTLRAQYSNSAGAANKWISENLNYLSA